MSPLGSGEKGFGDGSLKALNFSEMKAASHPCMKGAV